jgi:PBP1b-binding outer membrane lipoprotein LpoB
MKIFLTVIALSLLLASCNGTDKNDDSTENQQQKKSPESIAPVVEKNTAKLKESSSI